MSIPPAPPPSAAEGKREQVAAMFDRIAPRYDLLNRVLSGGVDVRWRRRAVRVLGDALVRAHGRREGLRLLDVATGTADLAIEATRLQPREVVGVDPAEGMLALGRKKVAAAGLGRVVRLESGASEALPFPDGAFDGALCAFGARNFEDLGAGLREIGRVLRPGAPLVVLEFSRPDGLIAPAFAFYFRHLLPRVGGLVSGDPGAYTYLHDSVQVFPEGPAFLQAMAAAGLAPVRQERLTFGIASLYLARAR